MCIRDRRDTSVVGGVRRTISTSELRAAQARIKVEEENRKNVQSQREIAADSLRKFQVQVLELDNNTELAGELGPLQYLSGLTGVSMDKIINWLLLIIIFVFDPLAISLVIAANFAFTQAYPKKKYRENLYGDKVEEQVKDMRKVVDKYDDLQDGMDIWDSTLQDGLEDEPWEPVKEVFNILVSSSLGSCDFIKFISRLILFFLHEDIPLLSLSLIHISEPTRPY